MSYDRVAKITGADVELANFLTGRPERGTTARLASKLLLAAIDGVRVGAAGPWPAPGRTAVDPQDHGRTQILETAGAAYIDMDHLEICLPETWSAWDHVAAWHAMLRIVRRAAGHVTAALADGERIHVLVNNSDGRSHSWGGHLNVLITREAWDRIFNRRLQQLSLLASHQTSSIVYTGQGKVGSEQGLPWVPFQLSQRADFFEALVGWQTTYARPIVNTRDEALARARDLARVHCIFFDSVLAPTARLLQVGTMQVVLAMLEAGWADTQLLLEEPVDAVQRWSRDPGLAATAPLLAGGAVTAIEMQLRICEAAQRFVEGGGCAGVVPRADEIVACWAETLGLLERRDRDALAGRLDWVGKLALIEGELDDRPALDWHAPEIKYLDHAWGSLDPAEGLYGALADAGLIDPVVSDEVIAAFETSPPADTRAWTRAMLLRRIPARDVADADWDRVTVWDGPRRRRVVLDDPRAHGRDATARHFEAAPTVTRLLDALGAEEVASTTTTTITTTYDDGGDDHA